MSDCVLWDGRVDKDGYGYFAVSRSAPLLLLEPGKTYRAHRVAFFFANGFWPKICRHSCDTPSCINHEHLLDGSIGDNNRDTAERGRHANQQKTRCPKGHPLVDGNIRWQKNKNGVPARVCLRCRKDQAAAYYKANRDKRLRAQQKYYDEHREEILIKRAQRYQTVRDPTKPRRRSSRVM